MIKELQQFFTGNSQEQAVLRERNRLHALRVQGALSRRAQYKLEDLEEEAQEITRRLFWRKAKVAGAGLALAAVGIPAVRYFLSPNTHIEPAPLAPDGFELANCDKVGAKVPKPKGWTVLEIQVSSTFANCYISEQRITREEDFKTGLSISKLTAPLALRDSYAKQRASQRDGDLLPIANSYKETRVGSLRVFSGRFTGPRNNVLLDEEKRVIIPDGSDLVYIAAFSSPKSSSAEQFGKYGTTMLDGIMINGLPTK